LFINLKFERDHQNYMGSIVHLDLLLFTSLMFMNSFNDYQLLPTFFLLEMLFTAVAHKRI